MALRPINILRPPDVILEPAEFPIPILPTPVALSKALDPIAIEVLHDAAPPKASAPMATL